MSCTVATERGDDEIHSSAGDATPFGLVIEFDAEDAGLKVPKWMLVYRAIIAIGNGRPVLFREIAAHLNWSKTATCSWMRTAQRAGVIRRTGARFHSGWLAVSIEPDAPTGAL